MSGCSVWKLFHVNFLECNFKVTSRFLENVSNSFIILSGEQFDTTGRHGHF